MPEPKDKKTDEEEVFEEFGITDDEDKKAVKMSAATRVLAAKKINKLGGKNGRTLW